MRIIHGYLGRTVIGATLVTLMMLVVLRLFFDFMEELDNIGQGDYRIAEAIYYILLTAPGRIYEFFPMSVVIGGMVGLGNLAAHSELTILRAAGISTIQICLSVLRTALLLMILVFVLGEYVAPRADALAQNLRAIALHGDKVAEKRKNIWLRNGNHFVLIDQVEVDSTLTGIQFFQLDQQMRLTKVFVAERGQHQNSGNWLLTGITGSELNSEQIYPITEERWIWQKAFTPEQLGLVQLKPESLNLTGLSDYIGYLKENQLDSSRYQLAFWRKIVNPISVGVMLMLSLSFIFGPLRSGTMGGKILVGVMSGFAFSISNRVFGDTALIYQLHPLIGAVLPALLFSSISVYLLKRAG